MASCVVLMNTVLTNTVEHTNQPVPSTVSIRPSCQRRKQKAVMHRPITLVTVAVTLALAACGSSSETLPAATSLDTVTTTAAIADPDTADDPAPATTAAPTPETTAAPVTPTTEAAPSPAEGGDAECLNGEWLADASALQDQLAPVAGPLSLTIGPDSFNRATLDDGTFVVDAAVELSAEIPGTGVTLSATATTHLEGTYTTDGNTVIADVTVDSGEIGSWSASIDGETIDLPPGAADAFGDPPAPVAGFNGSTFDCTDTSLTFDVIDSEYGTITYTRVS
jgi:hypothetical protein